MQRIYTTPVGTDLIDATLTAGHIAGVQVDNPSGSWLLLSGINQYVPPYRLGWAFPVSPQQTSISVRFVDSPSGSLSELVGDPVKVTLSDVAVAAAEGFPSGAGARVTIVPRFRFDSTIVVAKVFANALPVLMITAVRPIIIRNLSCTYDMGLTNKQAQHSHNPSANVQVLWEGKLGASFSLFQGISPETPYAQDAFQDGAIVMPVNSTLEVSGIVEDGGENQGVTVQAQYYEEAS